MVDITEDKRVVDVMDEQNNNVYRVMYEIIDVLAENASSLPEALTILAGVVAKVCVSLKIEPEVFYRETTLIHQAMKEAGELKCS